jgi:hypothetical protein
MQRRADNFTSATSRLNDERDDDLSTRKALGQDDIAEPVRERRRSK